MNKKPVSLGEAASNRREIRTNMLEYRIDDAIDDYVNFWRVRCNNWSVRSDICDFAIRSKYVFSVVNSAYRDSDFMFLYIMTFKDPESDVFMGDMKTRFGTSAAFQPVVHNAFPKRILLQLLINSMAYTRMDKVTNASGNLYAIHGFNMYEDNDTIPREIVALEFRVIERESMESPEEDALYLKVSVVTFTNLRDKDKIDPGEGKTIESFPKYVLGDVGIRRYDPEFDIGKEVFIIRKAYDADKNVIQFFDAGSMDNLENTKVWQIDKVIGSIDKRLKEYASIGLKTIDMDAFEPKGVSCYNYYHNRAIEITNSLPVYAVNRTEGDNQFSELCSHLRDAGVNLVPSKGTNPDTVEIPFVHERGYYRKNGISDPHTYSDDCVRQHVTIETIDHIFRIKSPMFRKSRWKIVIGNVVENIAVKLENHDKEMHLSEWPLKDINGNKLSGTYTFATRIALKNEKGEEIGEKFLSITVSDDGKFEYGELPEDSELIDVLSVDPANAKHAVMDPEGNINVIWTTDFLTIPDSEAMHDELERLNGSTVGLASKEGRTTFYPECIDIGYLAVSFDTMYYFCGNVGAGTKKNFANAVNIRKVKAWKDSRLFFTDLIPILAVPYVRHNQTTVLPFPFKNLRELAKQDGYYE